MEPPCTVTSCQPHTARSNRVRRKPNACTPAIRCVPIHSPLTPVTRSPSQIPRHACCSSRPTRRRPAATCEDSSALTDDPDHTAAKAEKLDGTKHNDVRVCSCSTVTNARARRMCTPCSTASVSSALRLCDCSHGIASFSSLSEAFFLGGGWRHALQWHWSAARGLGGSR